MDFVAAKPAIIIPAPKVLLPNRKLIMPAISFISSGRFGGAAGAALTYRATTVDMTDLTTYTFSTQDIGAADGTRRVIVGVAGFSSSVISARTLSSATIAGGAATIHVNPSSARNTAIISAQVAAGTTATIALTFSGAMRAAAIHIYRLINETSGTPFATGSATYSGANATLNINVPSIGALVAVTCADDSSNPTFTWTGATERADVTLETTVTVGTSSASESGLGSQTGRTVTATESPGTPTGTLSVLTWA